MSQSHVPLLTVVGTRLDQPVMTWHPHWLPTLEAFAACDPAKPVRVMLDWYSDEKDNGFPDETFYLDTLPDSVARSIRAMGESAWHVPVVPEGGFAHLEGMLPMTGTHTASFLCALKGAIVEAAANQTAGLKGAIGMGTGSEDGSFPVHCDLFPGKYLLTVFVDPAPDDQGASLFLSVDAYEPLLVQALGVDIAAQRMPMLRREVAWHPDHYNEIFAYDADLGLIAATNAAARRVLYARGEGYLVDDARWMHGRTVVRKGEFPTDRIHRLTFDTERSLAERPAVKPEQSLSENSAVVGGLS